MTLAPPRENDLATCDREPIHLAGSIQPHGMLLIVEGPGLHVSHASRNAAGWLGRDLGSIVGAGVEGLFGPEFVSALRDAIDRSTLDQTPQFLARVAPDRLADGRPLDAIAHRGEGVLILEFEPGDRGHVAGVELDFNRLSRDILGRLDRAATTDELCRLVAGEVRRLIGFDRALVYRFDEDWNGTVIAEDGNGALPSYLGLRFPASDIPAQARELYRANLVRSIAEAGAAPVPIDPPAGPESERPIDLRSAALRSVSPGPR